MHSAETGVPGDRVTSPDIVVLGHGQSAFMPSTPRRLTAPVPRARTHTHTHIHTHTHTHTYTHTHVHTHTHTHTCTMQGWCMALLMAASITAIFSRFSAPDMLAGSTMVWRRRPRHEIEQGQEGGKTRQQAMASVGCRTYPDHEGVNMGGGPVLGPVVHSHGAILGGPEPRVPWPVQKLLASPVATAHLDSHLGAAPQALVDLAKRAVWYDSDKCKKVRKN